VGCLYCRIGWMKLFNPMKPEGSYELDLGSHWEERMVVKSLCTLATNEPGENWPCFSFRWSDMEIIPGWALTSVWLTDAGLPPRGVLSLTFYTGDGQGNFGCYAHVAMRRALCAMFHVDERCSRCLLLAVTSVSPPHTFPFSPHVRRGCSDFRVDVEMDVLDEKSDKLLQQRSLARRSAVRSRVGRDVEALARIGVADRSKAHRNKNRRSGKYWRGKKVRLMLMG
jgi:hypothetical protein